MLDVIVSPHLPTYPSHIEDARRIVRHGMSDVLAWLGEEVGPPPGEPTHALMTGDNRVFVSQELRDRMKEASR